MSEREKQILETVALAVPKMSDFDKGYLLGFSESRVSNNRRNKENESDANSGNRHSN